MYGELVRRELNATLKRMEIDIRTQILKAKERITKRPHHAEQCKGLKTEAWMVCSH
jgi:hypothetical protein